MKDDMGFNLSFSKKFQKLPSETVARHIIKQISNRRNVT